MANPYLGWMNNGSYRVLADSMPVLPFLLADGDLGATDSAGERRMSGIPTVEAA